MTANVVRGIPPSHNVPQQCLFLATIASKYVAELKGCIEAVENFVVENEP